MEFTKELAAAQIAAIKARLSADDTDNPLPPEIRSADEALLALLETPPQAPEPAPADLTRRVEVRNYLNAFARGNQVTGAEAELMQGLGTKSGHIPFEAIMPLEKRADAKTVLADTSDWDHNTHEILGRVFAGGDAAFLGLDMPMVPAGEAGYPVITSGVTGAAVAEGGATDAVAAGFEVKTALPRAIQTRYVYGIESAARSYGQRFEDALRTDLRAALMSAADKQLVAGSGTDPAIKGLLAYFTTSAATTDASWATYRNSAIDAVDSQYAADESAVRLLLGNKTYQHARKQFRSGTVESMDAIKELRDLGAMVQASAHIPAIASNAQFAIRTVEPMACVWPVWNDGILIIRDPYTGSASREVALTASILMGHEVVLRRTDGWAELSFKIS